MESVIFNLTEYSYNSNSDVFQHIVYLYLQFVQEEDFSFSVFRDYNKMTDLELECLIDYCHKIKKYTKYEDYAFVVSDMGQEFLKNYKMKGIVCELDG